MSLHLKSLLASCSSVLIILTGSAAPTLVLAQTSGAHSKAAAIPEKTPDGTWESLSPKQQQILAPLEKDWNYMVPETRKKWMLVANNIYPKMSEQDQQRLQSRMSGWYNLSQKDRRIARDNYLSSLKFPPEKKAEAWNAYQKLSDEQKKKLAEAEAKKKPKAISAPTLQQHTINTQTTPPPPAPKPRSLPVEPSDPPASENSSANQSN
jgi:Protein of unknown function (DUF3106)